MSGYWPVPGIGKLTHPARDIPAPGSEATALLHSENALTLRFRYCSALTR